MTTIQMITTFLGIGTTGVVIFIIVDAIPSKHSQRIKFNHFINLYTINPDRWELFGRYVDFVKPVEGYYKSWKETVMFQFNIIDYYRYQHWKRNLEKQKRQEKECKQLQEVISIIKSDLKKFEQENTKKMNTTAQEFVKFAKDEYGVEIQLDGKDPRVKALAKDIVNYINEGRKGK